MTGAEALDLLLYSRGSVEHGFAGDAEQEKLLRKCYVRWDFANRGSA
jgi:hypothetical protein